MADFTEQIIAETAGQWAALDSSAVGDGVEPGFIVENKMESQAGSTTAVPTGIVLTPGIVLVQS